MKFSIKDKYKLGSTLLVFGIVMGFVSCKEEVLPTDDERTTFLKTYAMENDDAFSAAIPMDNGEIMLVGSDWTTSEVRVVKIGESGAIIWDKKFNIGSEIFPVATKLRDGSVLINSIFSQGIIKINSDGISKFDGPYESFKRQAVWARAIEGDDGLFYISSCNGLMSGAPSQTYIDRVGQDGQSLDYYTLSDQLYQGKMLQYHTVRVKDGDFWIAGNLYDTWPSWSFGDPGKAFFAKLGTDGQVVRIDEGIDTEDDWIVSPIATKDGGMASLTAHNLFLFSDDQFDVGPEGFELFKTDDLANVEWRIRENLSDLDVTGTAVTSLYEMSNGGYLVGGYCNVSGHFGVKPFAVEFSAYGKLVSKKVFTELEGSGVFYGVTEVDGFRIFVGATAAFGKTFEGADALVVKTDANWNFR